MIPYYNRDYQTMEIEMAAALKKYGCFNSTHEAYGVLREEVDEFFDLVKSKDSGRSYLMQEELIQIAAIALRASAELRKGKIKWV